MANNKPTAADVPEHIMDSVCRKVAAALDSFYADPANEAAFQAWLKKKREASA